MDIFFLFLFSWNLSGRVIMKYIFIIKRQLTTAKTLSGKRLILTNFLFPKKLGTNGTKMIETTCFNILKFTIPFFVWSCFLFNKLNILTWKGISDEDKKFRSYRNVYQLSQLPSKSVDFYLQNTFIVVSENICRRTNCILPTPAVNFFKAPEHDDLTESGFSKYLE